MSVDNLEIDQRYKWGETAIEKLKVSNQKWTDGEYKDKLKWDRSKYTEGIWNTEGLSRKHKN